MKFIKAYFLALFFAALLIILYVVNLDWIAEALPTLIIIFSLFALWNLFQPLIPLEKEPFRFLKNNWISKKLASNGAVTIANFFIFLAIGHIAFIYFSTPQVFDSENKFSYALEVSLAAPQGGIELNPTTNTYHQISFTFNQRMIKLGDDKKYQGPAIKSEPKIDCEWVWISESSLGCNNVKLSNATNYQVTLPAGVLSLSGYRLHTDKTINFSVSPPKIVHILGEFRNENPHVKIEFNQPVKSETISGHFNCANGDYELNAPSIDSEQANTYQLHIASPNLITQNKQCKLIIRKGVKSEAGPVLMLADVEQNISIPHDIRMAALPFQIYALDCDGSRYTENLFDKQISCSASSLITLYFNRSVLGRNLKEHAVKVEPTNFKSLPGDFNPKDIDDEKQYTSVSIHKVIAEDQILKILVNSQLTSIEGEQLSRGGEISISAYSEPPSFKVAIKTNSVREKFGDWQIPYQSKNISGFKLNWLHINNSDDLHAALKRTQNFDFYGFDLPADNKQEAQYEVQFESNTGEIYPLDLKKLSNISGLFVLNFSDPQVEPPFLNAYKEYVKAQRAEEDHWKRKYNPAYIPTWGPIPNYKINSKTTVLVTDIGLHVKMGYFNTLVWAFSIHDGKPLPNVSIEVFNTSEKVASGTTDSNGLIQLTGLEFNSVYQKKFLITGKTSDDFTFILTDYQYSAGISYWDFNFNRANLTSANNFLVETLTDRPIYKPGEKVSLKVFSREWSNETLSFLPRDFETIDVEINDPTGNKFYSINRLKLSEFGTAHIEIPLKTSARTGEYQVRVKKSSAPNDYYAWRSPRGFSVQEFRAPNFEIFVAADKKITDQSKELSVSTKASYLFGGAVKNAQGKFFVTFEEKDFTPIKQQYQEFYTYDYYDEYYRYKENLTLLDYDFKTDEKGEFKYTFKPSGISTNYGVITIESNIEDEHGAKIANRTSVTFYDNHPFLGLKLDNWSYNNKEKIKPQVILLDAASNFVENEKVELELIKNEYITTRRLGTGNYYYYDTTHFEKSIDKCTITTINGISNCELKPADGGSYFVKATYKNTTKKYHTYVYSNEGYINWGHTNNDRIDIIPERSEYNVGETAKVLIKSPYPESKALITIERHGILSQKVITINSGAYIYEFPLDKESYAPGIYISAVLLQGRTSNKVDGDLDLGKPSFKIGYAAITVSNPDTKITTIVKTKFDKYEPGQTVDGSLTLKDQNGKPIIGEVAIAVVDKAILQLVSNYKDKYNLHDTFYRKPGLEVENFQTLNNLLGRITYGRKGGDPGGGGGIGLREEFLPLAYWEPAAITNSSGEFKFSFKAPDNLTQWALIVVATDKSHRFGFGESLFVVNKSLMIEPALPNFLTEDDVLNAKFAVHNRSGGDLNVNYVVKSQDFKITNSSGSILVKDDNKNSFTTSISPLNEGELEIIATAEAEKYNDGVKVKLPVIPTGTYIIEAIFGTTEGNEIEREYIFPTSAIEKGREVNLLFATSILQSLDESFRYVIEYPYGCWEQRLSRTLFLGQYNNLRPWLKVFTTDIEINETVNKILAEASKYQDSNGGMKYYPSEYGFNSPYLSYFTAYAFMQLENAGFSIDQEVKDRLENYLYTQLSVGNWPSWWHQTSQTGQKILNMYILDRYFKRDVDSYIKKYLADLDNLDLESITHLFAMIQNRTKYQKWSQDLLNRLLSNLDIQPRKIAIKTQYQPYKYMLRTETKLACQILNILIDGNHAIDIVPKMVNSISQTRNQGRWYNTQENMYCFEALYNYAKKYEKENPNFKIEVFDENKSLGGMVFAGLSTNTQDLKLTSEKLKPSGKLKISKNGPGRLYFSILQKYRTTSIGSSESNRGFSIYKSIYRYDEKSPSSWELLSGDIIKLKKGDILKVLLNVSTPTDRFQVGINDPLAGGLEPVNTALATASTAAVALAKPVSSSVQDKYDYFSYFYRSNGFSHMDLRLQSVQFYTDWLPAGTYQSEYMLQVIASGTFIMNPTRIEEMYYPEVYGITSGRKVIINE